MICAWIDTSNAETGSSQTMKEGSTASARAIPIRWRCPPENSCGYLDANRGERPTRSSSSAIRSSRIRRVRLSRWMSSASPRMPPMLWRGSSDANGSWKIIAISRRILRIGPLPIRNKSRPLKKTSPDVGSTRRRMDRPRVDLPHPDSPTRPNVSPWRIARSTPSTART